MPLTTAGYQVICCHSINKYENELVVMIPISEEEEKKLDSGFLMTNKGNASFKIHSTDIICYGNIDFHTNSDDFYAIENMKWLDFLIGLGICVPSDYNYDEHCCYSPIKRARYYDTTNPAVISQYKHAVLGKPERCCIFREIVKNVRRVV